LNESVKPNDFRFCPNLTALSRQVFADLVENGEASLSSAKPAT